MYLASGQGHTADSALSLRPRAAARIRRPYSALWRPLPVLAPCRFPGSLVDGSAAAKPGWADRPAFGPGSCGPRCRLGSGLRSLAFRARGPKLRDVGVDPLGAVEAGDGDAVVAVLYEVGVAQSVQRYRRKGHSPMERQVHALPSLPRARAKGHEGAVEVCATSHAPDHLLQIDDPPSPAQPIEGFQGSSRFVERRQCVLRCGFSTETLRQTPQPRPAPRAAEVPVRLLVEVHQDHHSTPLSVFSVV